MADDTDATHDGRPEAGVAVSVKADTAVEAVTAALAGSVRVDFAGASVDYAFGPDAVGDSEAAGKPFVVRGGPG